MIYSAYQKKILKDLETRKPTVFQRASMGEKSARQIVSGMGFDADIDDGDFDGPKDYQNNE